MLAVDERSGLITTMELNEMISIKKEFRLLALACGLALVFSTAALAQDNSSTQGNNSSTQGSAGSRSVANGQKMTITGNVTRRDADSFAIKDANGAETVVKLTDRTTVKTEGGFLRGGKNYSVTNILRGLRVKVEGRGDGSGQLVADKIRFSDTDLRTAQSLEARVDPVENRVGTAENRIGQVEQNAQRLSGQIDELAAVSNAAKGGAKAAQETADAAVAGVNATNDRISALDDYTPQETAAVNFKVGSATLLPDAKTQLDTIATKALNARGYVIEVLGYTDASGSIEANRRLSQRRADAVVRYLVENHNIPIRRIITPYGLGEAQAVADNKSRQGRAQNRRVEVKILVNKGLQQGAPTMTTPSASSTTAPGQ
jgi:OOP family OmpA-OmpF porin